MFVLTKSKYVQASAHYKIPSKHILSRGKLNEVKVPLQA